MAKPRQDRFRELTEVPGSDVMTRQITKAGALRSLGEVVYAVRCGDAVKIGYTTNLAKRMNSLKADDVLGFRPGTKADEQALHEQLAEHRHHGREWYRPTPAVLAVVNEMRETLGLEPLAA